MKAGIVVSQSLGWLSEEDHLSAPVQTNLSNIARCRLRKKEKRKKIVMVYICEGHHNKIPQAGGQNYRNLFSCNFGVCIFEIKVSTGLVSSVCLSQRWAPFPLCAYVPSLCLKRAPGILGEQWWRNYGSAYCSGWVSLKALKGSPLLDEGLPDGLILPERLL